MMNSIREKRVRHATIEEPYFLCVVRAEELYDGTEQSTAKYNGRSLRTRTRIRRVLSSQGRCSAED
jgi:hypothetical protein